MVILSTNPSDQLTSQTSARTARAGVVISLGLVLVAGSPGLVTAAEHASAWELGKPIVTYWAGPPMTDATATQMAQGGFNLVWCTEKELEVAHRHGLRAQLQDPLLSPASLDQPAQRQKLDALIARVREHPALYSYFITDEPNATSFVALGKLVGYLREHDPRHLAYINLFPTYATNEQLGNRGDTETAYREHLTEYIDQVHPSLISYDHYQFTTKGDSGQYFLNLALIRDAAQHADLPFLNIVQACTWAPSMRVPEPDEMRYLVYTTLAYGAQGISYYVYSCAGHTGGIAKADGTPTPIYYALKSLNREFVTIAAQLQHLRSLAVYMAGMQPPGTTPLPQSAVFKLAPPIATMEYQAPERVRGVLLGYFGPATEARKAKPTHVLVVNLDYKTEVVLGLRGPARLQLFEADTGRWRFAHGKQAALRLPPGGGVLVRREP